MTTAPITAEDFLDFVITDPGTVRNSPTRTRTPAPVCRKCQPKDVARARKSGADLYSSCFVCEAAAS